MSSLLPGRILFGIAVTGFGAICVVYVDFVNSLQPVDLFFSPGTAAYGVSSLATGLLLSAAGLGILADVRMRLAGLAIAGFLALWILLLHVPSAFSHPALLRSPWWIRTFETLALAGAALILAGTASRPARDAWIRAGRIAFGIALPVFGVLHFVYPESVAGLVALSPAAYPWPLFWAYLTGAGHFAAGVAIASGVLARPAATLAGLMYAVWALTLHLPRIVEHPQSYSGDRQELTSLCVCVAFWGAAWIVAASLDPGRSRDRQQ